MRIRSADPDRDAAACAAIYRPHVEASAVSFEEAAPGEEAMLERIRQTSLLYPWLVAEQEGAVVGFAYACRHRSRPAYRWSVDVSAYVDEARLRRGVGTALYRELLARLRGQGFHTACAGITLPNAGSVALHEALGFRPVGVYRGIGWKAGAWRDVGWWQLRLQKSEGVPREPGPPRGYD